MNQHVPFPLVIPIDHVNKIYRGYIQINNEEYFIQAKLGLNGSLHGSSKLDELIADKRMMIQNKLQESRDISQFLSQLKETLETSTVVTGENDLGFNSTTHESYAYDRYKCIYQELSKIGYEHVQHISQDMTELTLVYTDTSNRIHTCKIEIGLKYPFMLPKIIQCELPVSIESSIKISDIMTRFVLVIESHQTLFDALDDLDNNMRIIEPDRPTRRDMWRKIALGHHCSLEIRLDNEMMDEKPKIRFFGSSKRVQTLKSKWDDYVWDKSTPIHMNLLLLVSNDSKADEDYTNTDNIECGICYTYKFNNGDIPETVCANANCNRGFHSICLYQWLRSNPTTTQSFNILFGKCPYCNEKITIKAII